MAIDQSEAATSAAPPTTTAQAPARSARNGAGWGKRMWSLPGVLLLILAWELVPRLSGSGSFPPLSAVLSELGEQMTTGRFWTYVVSTMRTWAIGLVVATVVGVGLGFLLGTFPRVERYTRSMVEFLRPIPSVALIPAVILLFGTKFESGVVLITYAAVWPMLLQTLFGLNDLDSVAKDTASSYRFSRWGYMRHVQWPSLMPPLFTGVRLAASIALVLAITGEMVIGTVGLGQGITVAQTSGATSTVYALVLVSGLMGLAVNQLARVAEKRLLWWHPMIRNAAKEN